MAGLKAASLLLGNNGSCAAPSEHLPRAAVTSDAALQVSRGPSGWAWEAPKSAGTVALCF